MSDHPVDQLNQAAFDELARLMTDDLRSDGYAIGALEPNDMTRYVFAVMLDKGNHCWFANSFGPLYQWARTGHTDWGYVLSHYIGEPQRGSAEWTARVISRFLNTLADKMRES
jgi:hypothetical protein